MQENISKKSWVGFYSVFFYRISRTISTINLFIILLTTQFLNFASNFKNNQNNSHDRNTLLLLQYSIQGSNAKSTFLLKKK